MNRQTSAANNGRLREAKHIVWKEWLDLESALNVSWVVFTPVLRAVYLWSDNSGQMVQGNVNSLTYVWVFSTKKKKASFVCVQIHEHIIFLE